VINDFLPLEEHQALEAILRHHDIDPRGDGKNLARDLAQLGNWIHLSEQAKFNRNLQPPFLLVLLSLMGIYKPGELSPPTPTPS
jgi:hypothetical protein